MSIKEIALDLTVFTLSNVNDAISFKPQLCFEVPRQDYQTLKENFISFTGTSIRKNRSKLYFLPTNVSDELQKLNPSIPEDAKRVPMDGRVYYKNRLITELDYENVKRVEVACAFIAYTALNSFAHFETESQRPSGAAYHSDADDSEDDLSVGESVGRALRKGNILGFRELGHLVGITPWHFHRVFKVITGLTIREYGQLCVEFIKKNKEIVNTCRAKVEQLKLVQRFSCLDDTAFLQDGGLQYAATENVVLMHEYFIDPNKSKEFKTRKNGVPGNRSSSQAKRDLQPHDDHQPLAQRSEIRKRRSSVMHGRMQRASQSSITSNSSLYECLQNSSSRSNLRSPDFYLSNEEPHSENESDDSAASVLEAPTFNMFPAMTKSVSPPVTSRKGSIISIGSGGAVGKKTGKRKSVSGANIDAMQSSMLHRRNISDGCGINLNFEPLQQPSLDARLSPPHQSPIEFNANVFGGIVKPAPLETETAVDFSVGPLDYNMLNENLFDLANPKVKDPAASMTDVSLFNNSLLEQTTPAQAGALELTLDSLPEVATTTGSNTSYVPDLRVDELLDPSSLLDGSLAATQPAMQDSKRDYEAMFTTLDDGDLLFDAGFPTGDPLPSLAVPAPANANVDAFNF